MKIAIASDHRGFKLKNELTTQMFDVGDAVEWVDLGPTYYEPTDDYSDYAYKLVECLKTHSDVTRGVLICGSGVGMSIVANKFVGIRCGVGINSQQVVDARKEDDINVLAIASDFFNILHARTMVVNFLKTPFDNLPGHARRLDKIRQLEESSEDGL